MVQVDEFATGLGNCSSLVDELFDSCWLHLTSCSLVEGLEVRIQSADLTRGPLLEFLVSNGLLLELAKDSVAGALSLEHGQLEFFLADVL